ncbi:MULTISPECIES: DUF4345 family protein [Pseudoalteromonas]|uniref:DUF4345 domain-containing protein n=1 Tax=Pseudoalteromonas luteoviolacea (strain 2ta16) TaxID=1353533 RepID=V4HMG6_PSEL2|nr:MULTISPECIES: DUF4345 family protein [Pseudoalteromonas]ESP90943.1 hypothetical protein PL2TA16_01334 [Pseudoalteromonas luteoviolacea 2ta16]KZN38300.1 hypothetical protein N483_20305 [Pseudoalteromonas luteoviolacea NCIMB 1944]MCG7547731.1 DUF4345 family protein [Pseudoalteromonas sp. Of7M-16]
MTKRNIGRTLLGLLAAFFIPAGLMFMFAPNTMLAHVFISPIETASGLSSVRALWGGTATAIWISVLVGAFTLRKEYCLVGILSLSLVLLGRLVSYIVDGSFSELAVNLIPTVVALSLLLVGTKLISSQHSD